METKIFKGRDGWQAESMTETDANGKAWQITTHKTRGGVKCYAIQGESMTSGGFSGFSYDIFGAKRLDLAKAEGQCNESKVKAVHAAGLVEFARIMAETTETKPAYIVGPGQVVFTDGYSDDHRRVIYEIERPGHYKAVSLDGETLSREDHVKPYAEKFGIGVYYKEGDTLPMDQVAELVARATAATEAREQAAKEKAEAAAIEKARAIEAGSKIIAKIPDGVKSVIVAEFQVNDSDPMTDYFSSHTEKIVYLAFSTHTRDIFSEMRKAAAKFEHTAHFATAPEKPADAGEHWTAPDEHREKYSMGSGYYLANHRHSGWQVSKSNVGTNYGVTLEALQIAAADGRFFCDVEPEKEPVNIEPVEVVPGTVNIIEYSEKAVAVVGDTRPIKDKLKALGGSFNFRLSCGPGWIFPKTKLTELQTALTA